MDLDCKYIEKKNMEREIDKWGTNTINNTRMGRQSQSWQQQTKKTEIQYKFAPFTLCAHCAFLSFDKSFIPCPVCVKMKKISFGMHAKCLTSVTQRNRCACAQRLLFLHWERIPLVQRMKIYDLPNRFQWKCRFQIQRILKILVLEFDTIRKNESIHWVERWKFQLILCRIHNIEYFKFV